jgi:hypothetical protein
MAEDSRMSLQIIEIDDAAFPEVLEAFRHAQEIGRFERNGQVHIVTACRNLVLIGCENDPAKISLRPTRDIRQARELALAMLEQERERGNEVKSP